MPPAQIKVPLIKAILGNPTNAQYTTMKDTITRLIVNIGHYHLWYYDGVDRDAIWSVIFRIGIGQTPAGLVPAPGPGVVVPRNILLGVYHLFLSCQKTLLGTAGL